MAAFIFQSCTFLFLSFLITFVSTQSCNNRWYTIRSVSTGLAMDARDPTAIRLKYFDGSIYQQWKFDIGFQAGSYYIWNRATGNVLDQQASESYVITAPLQCPGHTQLWTLHADSRISSWSGDVTLDVENNYLVDEARLWLSYKTNTTIIQQFVVQEYI